VVRRTFMLFSLAETAVQGQLYQQILNHIPDPDLRQLAHPGLVVRRVTRDVIKEVLARISHR
jgi:hypothetical protein